MEVKKVKLNIGKYLDVSQKPDGTGVVRYEINNVVLSGEEDDILATLHIGELLVKTYQFGRLQEISYHIGKRFLTIFLGPTLGVLRNASGDNIITGVKVIGASFNDAPIEKVGDDDMLFSATYHSSGKLVGLTLEER